MKHVKRMFFIIVANSSLKHDDLLRMTIPQIQQYCEGVMRFSITFHGMIGDEDDKRVVAEKEHTIADALAFVEQFRGFGG